MKSWFREVEMGPPIEPFHLQKMFKDDTHKMKVDLSLGVYKGDDAKPWILPVVRKAEQYIAADDTLQKDYLPILGLKEFTTASVKLLLGNGCSKIATGRAFGVQTMSGTGALRVGAELLRKHLKFTVFYYSNPSWVSHYRVFTDAGFTRPCTYRYWDRNTCAIDFDGLCEDLRNAPEGAVVILHACAHNPTGTDPSRSQWEKIADIMEERKLFPFFDCAYQGFASGDLDKDAWAVRYFVKRNFELVCAQSYSKNIGLYNERAGTLTVVLKDPKYVPAIKSQLTWIVNDTYFTPPAHGARIVACVLNNKQLYNEWNEQIKVMSSRVTEMRNALRDELVTLQTPGNWDHIANQTGMFSYTGLTRRQIEYLQQEYHIYLLSSGRANICGLNRSNVAYVARAIHDAVNMFPADQ